LAGIGAVLHDQPNPTGARNYNTTVPSLLPQKDLLYNIQEKVEEEKLRLD
jgi:hypothetical protein